MKLRSALQALIRVSMLLLCLGWLVACGWEERPPEPGLFQQQTRVLVEIAQQGAKDSRYKGTYRDVKAVDLGISGPSLNKTVSMGNSSGAWSVTVDNLTTGVSYNFLAKAYLDNVTKDNSTLLFSGQAQVVVDLGLNTLPIRLSPILSVPDNESHFPGIVRLAYRERVLPGDNQTMAVTLQANIGDNLSYKFGGDSSLNIQPSEGLIQVQAEYISLSPELTAPTVAGMYNYSIGIRNQQGLGVQTGFRLRVTDNISLSPGIYFNPVLLSLSAERENATHIAWEAVVTDDLDLASLQAQWSFVTSSGSRSFSDNQTTVNVDNVTFQTMMAYGDDDTGTLTLGLTNPQGDNTTVTYDLAPGQFSKNLQADPLTIDNRSLAPGDNHTCRLRSDVIDCWGDNSSWQLVVPELTQISQISSGNKHSCALAGNVAHCWGDNTSGQLGIALGGLQVLRAGGEQTCGISDNRSVSCWGANYGASPTPIDLIDEALGLDVGTSEACAIIDNRSVVCWQNASSIQTVANLSNAVQLSVGHGHACATRQDGQAMCWGQNDQGQLGDNSTTAPADNHTAVLVDLNQVARIEAGGKHTCAITENHRIRCWGRSTEGQLGSGQNLNPMQDPEVGYVSGGFNDVIDLALGKNHSCLQRKNGEVYCWGNNDARQVTGSSGDGDVVSQPTKIP